MDFTVYPTNLCYKPHLVTEERWGVVKISEATVGLVVLVLAAAALVFAYVTVHTGHSNSTWESLSAGCAGGAGVGGLVFGILHGVHNQPE